MEAFCDVSKNTLLGIRNATDNTVNGKRYYEPIMTSLFEFGLENEMFSSSIIQKYKERVNIVPKKNKNFSIVDQVFVSPEPNTRRLLQLFEYNFSLENKRLQLSIPDAYKESEKYGLPTFSCTQVKTSHADDPKITTNSLKSIGSQRDKTRLSTSHILKRTPECDAFSLLVNSYSNVTTATNVIQGNELHDLLSNNANDQIPGFKNQFNSLFEAEQCIKRRKVHASKSTEHCIQLRVNSDCHDLYAALSPAMKRLYQSNQLQKAILEKLSVYQDYKIPPEEVAKLF